MQKVGGPFIPLRTFPGADFSHNFHADAAQIFHTAVVREFRKGQLTYKSMQGFTSCTGSEEGLWAEVLSIYTRY